MKLSEAIREGAKLRPQGFGSAYERRDEGNSCAWEAAFEIAYNDRFAGRASKLARDCGIQSEKCHSCPVEECTRRDAFNSMIIHLNDGHRWTREQIADWVETIESESL